MTLNYAFDFQIIFDSSSHGLLIPGVLAVLLAISFLVFYRLVLHPLARYPGPRLAAISIGYEFYYDAIKGGMYTFEIQRMHEKYGPIVRISPNELHTNEPSFIDELYAGGGKVRDKYDYATGQFGIPDSVFGAVSHNLHRMRRAALNPFFSKASVNKLEPIIFEAVNKLCRQLSTYESSGKAVDLTMAFSCLTTDIVTEYAFAKSSNFLDSPTFDTNFHKAIIIGSSMGVLTKPLPWILTALRALPDSLMIRVAPAMGSFIQWQGGIKKQVADVQKELQHGDKRPDDSRAHATIFHELFTGNLPDSEKQPERMWQEGQIVVGAGTETTAWTLTATLFYTLHDADILLKLQRELGNAIPNVEERVPSRALETLPYLNAVICEGLRLSYGVATRLQRVNPNGPLLFRSKVKSAAGSVQEISYDIPAGTPVGMTSVMIHMNPELFPRPREFDPERWLDANGKRDRSLEKYLLSFSKGSRQCIGINLAYAELYLGLGYIIRRFGDRLRLFETDVSDVEMASDCFVPMPRSGSQGVRVKVMPIEGKA